MNFIFFYIIINRFFNIFCWIFKGQWEPQEG